MHSQRLIRRHELRRAGAALLLLVLLAAVVNVPLAVSWETPGRGMPRPFPRTLIGAGVPTRWPSETPHEEPWPVPDYWGELRSFGARVYDVRRQPEQEGRNGYSMQVERYGWPLGVIEKKQMWWDWDDPALKGPEPNPATALLLPGLLLNPLIVGGTVFMILFGPVIIFALARRAWRRQGRNCVWCGYPLGVSAVCTECGERITAADPVPSV